MILTMISHKKLNNLSYTLIDFDLSFQFPLNFATIYIFAYLLNL